MNRPVHPAQRGGRTASLEQRLEPPLPTIAVALATVTPELVREARQRWLPPGTPQLFAGFTDDVEHAVWYVQSQPELNRSTSDASRLGDDARVLRIVAVAARVLAGRFDWLALGEADTCFNLPNLSRALRRFDPTRRYLLGGPKGQRGRAACSNTSRPATARGSRACCAAAVAARGEECFPAKSSAWLHFFAPQMHRAPAWPHAGSGVVLSRGLLNNITAEHWLQCFLQMKVEAGAARLSSCVFTATGIGLTELPGLDQGLSVHRCLSDAQLGSLQREYAREQIRIDELGRKQRGLQRQLKIEASARLHAGEASGGSGELLTLGSMGALLVEGEEAAWQVISLVLMLGWCLLLCWLRHVYVTRRRVLGSGR